MEGESLEKKRNSRKKKKKKKKGGRNLKKKKRTGWFRCDRQVGLQQEVIEVADHGAAAAIQTD